MNPTDSPVSEGLSGLKPQLQSWPLSLEMVSELAVALPPPLPLPEPGLEVDWEPAVHPAAITPAATMTPYLMRRLMPFRPYCRLVLTGRGAARGCAPRRRLSRAGRPSRWSDVCCPACYSCCRGRSEITPSANFVRTVS